MARYDIEVGETEGQRVIGFRPALDDVLTAGVRQIIEGEIADHMLITDIQETVPGGESHYTEIDLSVINGQDDNRTKLILFKIIGSVTRKLVEEGHTTTVLHDVRPLDEGRHLFSG